MLHRNQTYEKFAEKRTRKVMRNETKTYGSLLADANKYIKQIYTHTCAQLFTKITVYDERLT